jgi:hypothetical protein
MFVQFQQKEVGTFLLDTLFEFIGFKALEFIISFGLFFALVYLGLSLMPFFKDDAPGKKPSAIIAIMAGLATSYYTYINNISIIDLIGPFSILLVVVLIAIVLIRGIAALRGGESPSILTTIGVVLLAVGFALSQLNHQSAFTLSAIGAFFLIAALVKSLIS